MNFKEEFPSLKDKCLSDVDYEPPTECDEYFTSKDFVKVKDVKKYCLDKQRVREAIPNIIKLFADGDEEYGVWGYDTQLFDTMEEAIKAVENELGL